jgi:hypothetical protein
MVRFIVVNDMEGQLQHEVKHPVTKSLGWKSGKWNSRNDDDDGRGGNDDDDDGRRGNDDDDDGRGGADGESCGCSLLRVVDGEVGHALG